MRRKAPRAVAGPGPPRLARKKKRAASPRPSRILAMDSVTQDFATLSIVVTRMTLLLVSSLPVTFTS